MKNAMQAIVVLAFLAILVAGFYLAQPRCPAHSAPLFFAYYGGWYCVATVERLP